ncbi:MAG: type III PLP-dependent enzyme [Proteobacteria bacterium]|nr:type III PLP-dependent enzyme [Pseudomonadota bacterium]
MTPKIERYLAEHKPPTPCLVVDLDRVAENYRILREVLPAARVFYAVKANPAASVLDLLVALGSSFDAASIYEIDACLAAGAGPERISFGNTIKKERDIAAAFARGVRLFAFDSLPELDKLARSAPGAKVFCRLLMSNEGADWPLSRKFGCEVEMARDLMVRARHLGLDPYGLSFHLGSQQRDPGQWDIAIGKTAMLFSALDEAGIELRMLNLGGGFPVHYREAVPSIDEYAAAIHGALARHFGNRVPETIIEPGRCITASAGVIETEVVLVSCKGYGEELRWVYLDVGKFGGLAETAGEAIRYRIEAGRPDGAADGPVAIAGPTCDGADILYETAGYRLPLDLAAGERVRIHAAGAYTSTYASIGFNGFPPLTEHYI